MLVQQIRSLHSRWAKLLKDGQLEEPKEKENIDTDEIEDTEEKNYAKATFIIDQHLLI